ncbi:MAG: hypothetical protein JSW26_02795 [Desulfobacterales bacterium]|nr:MAG: hypothetical protein JSW26_02795 [Desulfobacterales bacterium]
MPSETIIYANRLAASSEKTNPDSTTVTRQFHQDDFLKGKEARVELKDPEGTLLMQTIFSSDKEFADPAQDTVAFVRLDQKHSDFFLTPTVYRQTDYTCDATHGGVLTAITSGTDAEAITTAVFIDRANPILAYTICCCVFMLD